MGGHQFVKARLLQAHEERRLRCSHRCRTRFGVEQCHLAEHFSRAQVVQNHVAIVHAHSPFRDDVQAITVVSLADDGRPILRCAYLQEIRHITQDVIGCAGEESHRPEDCDLFG